MIYGKLILCFIISKYDGLMTRYSNESISLCPISDQGIPTSIDFVRNEPNQFVVSTTTSVCSIIDTETGAEVVALESNRTYG
jgi:hypothetical protein